MAKEKESPKPVLYHPILDKSIDDAVKDYQSLHSEGAFLEDQKERGHKRDALYATVVGHLKQHGVDEKTGKLKRYGYEDMKEGDKRKWSQDLVNRFALVGVEDEFGKEAVSVYAKNPELLRQYVEQHMLTEDVKTYEGLIDHVANMKNLKDGFYEDKVLGGVMDAYLGSLSTLNKNRAVHRRHILHEANDPGNHKKLAGHANKHLKPHKYQLSPTAGPQHMLSIIEAGAQGEFKPNKKAKFIEPIPEKK